MPRPENKKGRFDKNEVRVESSLTVPRIEVEAIMQAYAWLCENRKEHRTIQFYINRNNQLKIKMSREGDVLAILKQGV
jgi:hypothetical protein